MNVEVERTEVEFQIAEKDFNAACVALRDFRVAHRDLLRLRQSESIVLGFGKRDVRAEELEGVVAKTRVAFYDALARRSEALRAAGRI